MSSMAFMVKNKNEDVTMKLVKNMKNETFRNRLNKIPHVLHGLHGKIMKK
jgi:hypothetical protein